MPRSASLFYINLTKDLLTAGGYQNPDFKTVRDNFDKGLPRNTGRLGVFKTIKLLRAGDKFTFPVKTHAPPNPLLKRKLNNNKIKATFVYRDPRDVIVSALELVKKLRENGSARRYFLIGPYRGFARLKNLSGAAAWVNYQLFPRWKKWVACNNILTTKYEEDLITDTYSQLERLSQYLEIKITDEQIVEILKKYEPTDSGRIKGDYWRENRGYLKNKGVIGRYRTKFSPSEQEFLNQRLGKCIELMGY